MQVAKSWYFLKVACNWRLQAYPLFPQRRLSIISEASSVENKWGTGKWMGIVTFECSIVILPSLPEI